MAGDQTIPAELLQAEEMAVNTLGRIAQFWGFTFSLGRVFGLLYLSPRPLSRDDVQQRLAISAGSASMALSELLHWGVVRRVWLRGDRRQYFQAETDFWRMIANVMNERERREIHTATEQGEQALQLARRARRAARGPLRTDIDFALERMEKLHRLYSTGQKLLDLFLSSARLDIRRYRSAFETRG
jgi:HTH-type transcriptional regulator, glycine betaine synthesis regulator